MIIEISVRCSVWKYRCRSEQKKLTMERSYNITGKNRDEVIEILNTIVNNREDYREDAVFTFTIKPDSKHLQYSKAFKKEFQLKAKPTDNQPGSGILFVCQDGQFIARPYDKEMVKDLEEMYDGDTSAFARHLETLFERNETIAKYPFVTSEVYMLLLFEIGRRLVKDSTNSTPTKKEYDKLPIKEAIQGILTLLDKKKCKFSDVFLKEGRFHCFSGYPPNVREKAIEEINKALLATDGDGETESKTDDSFPEHFRRKLTFN